MGLTLFLNRRSGSVTKGTENELRQLFGTELQIEDVTQAGLGGKLADLARRGEGIVAAGGDGTISAVATHLIGAQTPLGILPLGTLNHLAKDLKIPLDPARAVDVALHGKRTRIDTACVNDRPFLNNSSLGLYPKMVMYRESLEQKGIPRWAALWSAAFYILTHYRSMYVEFEVGGRKVSRRTPLIFVGNNLYVLEGLKAGSRQSLQDGVLVVVIARHASVWSLLRGILRVLFGRPDDAKSLEVVRVTSLTVRTRSKHPVVSIDGEVAVMESPLRYSIRPQSLTVLVPQE